eukprot:CAMPEP_0174825496 /NCGR_PEP_ID=MMETSP1107-20130205/42817_1 /TAXON_ID=36770 /ORGANISM="Paraphysomonas vestita, Strain GFlagA" /LENGTH=87 /DNA_ID=CAMNT_0016057165 /DNA_START=644 /DNA_END=904 /DNA_ORIENTATION=-
MYKKPMDQIIPDLQNVVDNTAPPSDPAENLPDTTNIDALNITKQNLTDAVDVIYGDVDDDDDDDDKNEVGSYYSVNDENYNDKSGTW